MRARIGTAIPHSHQVLWVEFTCAAGKKEVWWLQWAKQISIGQGSRPLQETPQLAQPNTDNKTMGQNKNPQSVEWREFTELNEGYSALSVKFPKNGCGVCLVGFLGNIPSSGCYLIISLGKPL